MAITNAQQYQQLVNPPMKGNKRPGYRGEAAAASDAAAGRSAGRDTSPAGTGDVGDGGRTGAPSIGMINEIRRQNLEKAPDVKEEPKFNVLDFVPGIGTVRRIASIFGPIDNREFFQQKVLPAGKLDTSKYKNFDDYMKARLAGEIDAYGNLLNQDNNNNNIILPVDTTFAQIPSNMDQGTDTTEEDESLRLAFRAEGGIMGGLADGQIDEMGRQMYGLGKLVKKATRAVKKIAKSPIGKAALLYTGAGALGNLAGGSGLAGMFKGFTSPSSFLAKDSLAKIFTRKGLGNILVGGKDFFGERARDYTPFSGLFGKGGELSPFRAITAVSAVAGLLTPEQEEEAQRISDETGIDIEEVRNSILAAGREQYAMDARARGFKADGGLMRIGYQEGSKEPVAKKTMPLLDMGGKEIDLREDGGFVPIGRMEKADDVPARLSKNEFVFTADAVRNAGDGDVDKGAEVMYNMMKNLEAGGEVSEESQGLSGAREMFQTSKRLEEVL